MSSADSNATLLPPNSTALERALVRTAARAAEIPVPLRTLWDVDTCPERLLPWLAWALYMQTWQSDWPEAVKRARIRAAIDVHRRKGTAASVRAVVESFGGDIALREWWQTEPRGAPHTFTITLSVGSGLPQDAAFQRDILQAVDLTKPVRSQYALFAGVEGTGTFGVIAAARAVTAARLNLTG